MDNVELQTAHEYLDIFGHNRNDLTLKERIIQVIGELNQETHPHEIRPRSQTFMEERQNWIKEIEQTKQHQAKLIEQSKIDWNSPDLIKPLGV